MGKSKYPNKLDTSIEIPAVRDNIVEVGSDVLNSLRSAIFNIERTLGVNPQGATGNTVASRVNRSLDGNGNILKEALDKAGLLSGPITDSDVSKAAGISESKLKLEYPTTLLQDEISQLIKQVETILVTLEELSYLYAAHTHPEAKNRHKGHAIAIDAIERVESDTGMVSSERQTAQELFEAIFSSHINYDGSGISESNRSHEAKQLFFDKSEVSAYVDSEDVQGAIVDVLNQTSGQLEAHQNRHHSNGTLRTSILTGSGDDTAGRLLLDEQEVSFAKYVAGVTTKLSAIEFVNLPPTPSEPIERSDILRLYSGTDEGVTDYQVHSVTYSGTDVHIINIFGMLDRDSVSTDRAKVFKNKNAKANPAGLLATARPWPGAVNIDLIQIANPNSSTIVSRGIRPSEISINNRYIEVTVDDKEAINVDVWDGAAAAGQSIDTIVKAMNARFSEEAANVLAYRVDYDDLHSPEIALVHSLPSSSAQPFTLSVGRHQTDGGIDSMGFGYIEGEVINQGSGSEYYIQGESHSGLSTKLEQTGLTLLEGTSAVTSHSVGIDFEDYGVADGDLLVVVDSPSDDGTYVIVSVSPTSISVDVNQLTGNVWSDESTEETKFYILKNTISLRAFTFLKPYGTVAACALVDVFLNKDKEIFYNTRLEYGMEVFGASDSLVTVCDFEGGISFYTEASPGRLSASLTAGEVPLLALDGGVAVELPEVTSSYVRLKSGLYNTTLLLFVESSDLIKQKILNEGEFEILLHGESDVNHEENLLIARAVFDSKNTRIAGAGALLPRIFKKLEAGVTSDKDLSSKALQRVYQGPISETRSNGVTEGLKLTPATGYGAHESIDDLGNFVVNIAGGSCYVMGKRFTFSGYTNLVSDVIAAGPHYSGSADKVFIAINEWGEIVFAEAGGGGGGGGGGACICPFNADSHCILGVIEFDSQNPPVAIDLRLFLNDLDLTVLNSVTVSPQRGMGHFTEFGEAIKYAKRFGDLFPKAGVPTVHLKSGTHKVVVDTDVTVGAYTPEDHHQGASYYGSWINFPVNITGEGHSTVLDIMKIFSDAGEENDDRTEAGDPEHDGFLYIAGPGVQSTPNGNGDILDNGLVTLSNLRLKDCSVIILDPLIEDSDGNKLNWEVKIDNVIFDRSDKADFRRGAAGVWFQNDDGDGTELIGNLSISNCQFLNAPALLSKLWPASLHRNISFINNTFRGTGDGAISGHENYMVYNEGFGNIFDFQDAPSENNIEYRGNINADSDLGGALVGSARVDSDTLHKWGDRISRDLNVGGQVGVGKNVALGTLIDNCRLQSYGGDYDYAIGTQDGGIWVSGGNVVLHDNDLVLEDGNIFVEDGQVFLCHKEMDDGGVLGYSTGSLIIGNLTSDQLVFDRTGIHGRKNGQNNYLLLNKHGAPVLVGFDIVFSDTSSSGAEFQVQGDSKFFGAADITFGDLTINGGSDFHMYGDNVNLIESNLHFWGSNSKISFSNSGSLPNYDFALINVKAVDKPAMQFENSDSEYGEIAVQGTWTVAASQAWNAYKPATADNFSMGWWDRNNTLCGPVNGSNYFEVFKFNMDDGRLHIYQNSGSSTGYDGTRHGGLFLHKQGTHDDYTDTWRIMFNNLHGATPDVLSFSHGPDVRGYLRTTPSVGAIDFTGQHRSTSEENLEGEGFVGMIVCSNGVYKNTDLETKVSINEALPTVSLSREKNDKKVYGVISNCEDPDSDTREYAQGSFVTVADKIDGDNRLIINSLGEGGIWVCNINGDLENGDYITTCEIPGYGSRQDDDLLHNYTVAKITCDCNFDLNSSIYQCVEFEYSGKTYKKAFVGCTYHCG